jgi:ppGpp synthetase/RelA/SpoT-type nucleotidyltranferase
MFCELSSQAEFLKHYGIRLSEFRETGLKWSVLQIIFADYASWYERLQPKADELAATLKFAPKAHATSCRVKDPEHLIEKMIRDSYDKKSPCATPQSYRRVFKDLIGARVLHLLKEDWMVVHRFISRTYRDDLVGVPICHITPDDPEHIVKQFGAAGCLPVINERGYRSVHYVLRFPFEGRTIFAEIQVRTLFEEAWGEISHSFVYPYKRKVKQLGPIAAGMSYTGGTADAWASVLSSLSAWVDLPDVRSAAVKKKRQLLALEVVEKAKYAHKMAKALPEKVSLERKKADATETIIRDMLGLDPAKIH